MHIPVKNLKNHKSKDPEVFFEQIKTGLLIILMAVWIFFLCSPDCPKGPKNENSYWKCVSRHICSLIYGWSIKEGCNRGHGLSATIKLGSLEKPFLVETFFDQEPNKGFALLAAGQFATRLQEFGLWGS